MKQSAPLKTEAPSASRAPEPPHLLRRAILRTALGLVGLVVLVGFIAHYFKTDLQAFATWVYDALGVPGLSAIVFLSDSVITPIPPDVVLLVLANSPAAADWWWLIPALGLLSAVAGCVAWWLGSALGRNPRAKRALGRFHRSPAVISRYGRWGVALGALTPIPFSVTCWIAGMLKVPFEQTAPMTLLRIPRYVAYYLVIVYAERLAWLAAG